MEIIYIIIVCVLLIKFFNIFKWLLVIVFLVVIWNNLDSTIQTKGLNLANNAYQNISNYSPNDLQNHINGVLSNPAYEATIQPAQCPSAGNQTYISCSDCVDQQIYCLTMSQTGINCNAVFLVRLGMFQYTGEICK